jgi:hypothetical protein
VSGWTKVILATLLMVVAISAFNVALWRRMRDVRRLAELRAREEEAGGEETSAQPNSDRSSSSQA